MSRRSVEFQDLNYNLPFGIWLPSGERLKHFTLSRYTNRMDLVLGELEDMYLGVPGREYRIFSQFLPHLVNDIDGYTFKDIASMLGTGEKRVPYEMYLADVMTIIICARILSHGESVPLNTNCICDRQIKIMGGKNTAAHNLYTLKTYIWDSDQSPGETYQIDGDEITISPLKFKNVQFLKDKEYPLDIRLLELQSGKEIHTFYPNLSREIAQQMLEVSRYYASFGPEFEIDMDCPECGREWKSPITYDVNYPEFYLNLMVAPRQQQDKIGGTAEYLNKFANFLCFGEQAPCSDLQAVYELTPQETEWWVKEISEIYKKQQKELNRQKSKSRSK